MAYHPRKSPKQRVRFGFGCCFVHGYPSSGGILIKNDIDVVDALFLGINRLQPCFPSSDPTEDAFCDKLRCIGAKWWQYAKEQFRSEFTGQSGTEQQEAVTVFGWPEGGGVFVLRFKNEAALPKDFGRMRMCLNMEERCQVMKEYDANFYVDPKYVEELNGIARPPTVPAIEAQEGYTHFQNW